MFCNKCGNEIKEGENFCGKCGASIIRDKKTNNYINTNEQLKTNTKRLPNGVLIVVFILVIILLGMTISIFVTNSSKSPIGNINTQNKAKDNVNTKVDNTTGAVNSNTIQKNTLSLNDVQMNTKFTSLNDMNKVTEKIVSCAWQYVKEKYPNAKWNYCKIYSQDGYGRYNLTVDFVKSSTSEQASRESVIVWVKDINTDDMGYYYNYTSAYSTEWGKPLPSNIGE